MKINIHKSDSRGMANHGWLNSRHTYSFSNYHDPDSNGDLSASASEIEYWDIFRPDIYRYVSDGNIWMSPDTGKQIKLCPWLRKLPNQNKYICDIYYNHPDDCKYYPVTIDQMVMDECEMLEVQDMEKPKQAQKTLDKLLADSRPPFK